MNDISKDPAKAAAMAVLAVLSYLRGCDIKEPDEQLRWVESVCMEARSRIPLKR